MIIEDNFGDLRHFEDATRDEVFELIAMDGKDLDLEGSQNDSPTVQEMLDLSDTLGEHVTYHGYIIDKMRTDWRVSLEGFEIKNIDADTALDLLIEYGYADERTHNKNTDGTYNLYFCWD